MVTVTRALIPPLDEYLTLVRQVCSTRHFTNHGPMVGSFEEKLLDLLSCGCEANTVYVSSCANGTLGLELVLRALDLGGKRVVTTPFTYVATLSALLAVGCTPVFVDIDPQSLCITPEDVHACLDEGISAILPVHIYGNACDVKGFGELSKSADVPVIYDAAHAFGACYEGESLLTFGSLAVGSFHATKVFHTCEGGCVVSHDKGMRDVLHCIRAFGHVGDTHIMPGINAKMSEIHAAMGLCLLPYVQAGIAARKTLTELYDTLLAPLPLRKPRWREGLQSNYAYYPIIFQTESELLTVQAALNAREVFTRRYFYPALNTLPYLKDAWKKSCPVAESISHRVLCLPLYADLHVEDVYYVSDVIKNAL